MTVLIFTPTYDSGPRPEMMASVSQQTYTDFVHEVSWHNPFPGRAMQNVVAQYQRGRQMMLDGGYEAMLTVEHDMIIPANALQKLYDTDAGVVYGVYMLRHGTPTLNTWQYVNNRNLGMSLSLYPKEVKAAWARGWAEVCGVGWGCTLIRREVLEQIEIYANESTDAGDITFATNCVRAGFRQIARFDVPCDHIMPDGTRLNPLKMGGTVSRVLALQNVTVNNHGQSVVMKAGRYYTLVNDVAAEFRRVGYLKIVNEDDSQQAAGEREQPDITTREMAINPKAATRGKRAK